MPLTSCSISFRLSLLCCLLPRLPFTCWRWRLRRLFFVFSREFCVAVHNVDAGAIDTWNQAAKVTLREHKKTKHFPARK